MIRNSNPVFRGIDKYSFIGTKTATYGGIVGKTLGLFLVMSLSIVTVHWQKEWFIGNPWTFYVALIGGFIMVMWGSFKPHAAKVTAPLYAVLEGVLLGFITAIYSQMLPGIVESAILITLSIFLVMLVLYVTGVVRVGSLFRRAVRGALIGLVVFMFASMLISFFSPTYQANLYGNLNLILLISLISAGIASLMILVDLDNCTRLVQSGAPKEYEWIASLGLMVTIVWLFIEILRILYIFAARRD